MTHTADEKLYQLALTLTEGVGSVLIRHLISYCGSASEVYRWSSEKLDKIPGIGGYVCTNLKNKNVFIEAERILKQKEKEQVQLLFYTDKEFPLRLKSLYDSPAMIYYKGNADLNTSRSVGIVGTRQASEYGKSITAEIVQNLKEFNPLIISGLAYGIDIAAHKSSLENKIPTVAVMASGLDIIYPKEHARIAQSMLEYGGWISETPFGNEAVRQSFLSRNRIIAGLSDAIIIVESAKKGGAMTTAEYANNYHRDVFAVPGNLKNKFSEGANYLIKANKASIFTSVQDLVEALNWDITKKSIKKEEEVDLSFLTNEESTILALLKKNQSLQIDELSWQAQISMNRLAALLLNLEFQGFVKALPGKKFTLK